MEAGIQRWAVNSGSWVPSEEEFAAFVGLLPISERPIVMRYFRFEDRKRALVSRLLQRKLVHTLLNIAYDDIQIERTKEGKPYLANSLECSVFPNFNFNVSHHGHYVALASEPLCLVGVDVMTHEPIREEPPAAFFKSFRNCYTPYEWSMIWSAGCPAQVQFEDCGKLLIPLLRSEKELPLRGLDALAMFVQEAYIKAVGIGLGFELQRAEFFYPGGNVWSDYAHVRIDGEEKPNWVFVLHKLGDHHWACVARGPPNEAVESYKKTLRKTELDHTCFASALALSEKEFSVLSIWDLIPDFEKENFKKFKSNLDLQNIQVTSL